MDGFDAGLNGYYDVDDMLWRYLQRRADDVDAVALREPGPSFNEMAIERPVPYRPELTVYDVVEDCDLPHLRAALDERGVDVVDASAEQ